MCIMSSNRYTLLETRKDGTKFTNSTLKSSADQLQALTAQYEELQAELVSQVISVARTFVEIWEEVAMVVGELDVLAAFADLAVSAPCPYIRPTLLEAQCGELVLKGSRHPCVEAQDGVDFIKNDCEMVRGDSWFQIITGPNMGGKSTFIRQVDPKIVHWQWWLDTSSSTELSAGYSEAQCPL